MLPPVKFVKLEEGAQIPRYQTAGAAGMDLHAWLPRNPHSSCTRDPVKVYKGTAEVIRTGLAIELPPGYEAQGRSRSGLAAKHQLMVLNSPGTIDCDYRGEIMVILMNFGPKHYVVHHGDRICQLVIAPAPQHRIVEITRDQLTVTARGTGGHGSTGR